MCLLLKKEDLGRPAKGTITLVLEIIYNKVRIELTLFELVWASYLGTAGFSKVMDLNCTLGFSSL